MPKLFLYGDIGENFDVTSRPFLPDIDFTITREKVYQLEMCSGVFVCGGDTRIL